MSITNYYTNDLQQVLHQKIITKPNNTYITCQKQPSQLTQKPFFKIIKPLNP